MEHDTFRYTYSAEQQEEILRIRRKYAEPEADKMEQLRRLDRQAFQRAQAWAITLGILGTLIMGTGMSLCMTELSGFLGGTAMLVGVPVGLVGIVLIALAYPVFNKILKKEQKTIAPEILRLTDELLQ